MLYFLPSPKIERPQKRKDFFLSKSRRRGQACRSRGYRRGGGSWNPHILADQTGGGQNLPTTLLLAPLPWIFRISYGSAKKKEGSGFVGMVDLGVFAVTLLCPFVTISFSCEPSSSFYPSCVLKFRYSEKTTRTGQKYPPCFDVI